MRDVPPLIRDVLSHAFASAPDMELVQERVPGMRPAETVEPDVVIMTAVDEAVVIDVEQVLWRMPGTRVLVIRLDGREAVLYEWRLHGSQLGDLSPQEMVDAIRAAVRQREN